VNAAPQQPSVRTAIVAVAFTLGLHTLVSAAITVPQVLAPIASRELGLPASGVGIVVGLIFGSVLPMGLLSGFLFSRLGERRLCQLIAGFVMLSMLIGAGVGIAAQHTQLPLLFAGLLLLSAVPLGLAIGLVNMVGAQLLYNAVPPRIRTLAFSIKQTAVPLGGGLAGVLIPLMLLSFAWQVVVAAIALIAGAAVFAILAMPLGDAPQGTPRPISFAELLSPLKIIRSTPALRELGAVALFYNVYQLGLLTYLISYLHLEIGLSLLAAGAVFSALQITAIAGRIAWGVSVDILGSPRRQLGVIGLISAAAALAIGSFTPAWPLGAIVLVAIVVGGSSVAWNGMFMAEVARQSPAGEIGRTTGGVLACFAIGGLSGPALFAAIVALTGTYYPGFIVLAIPLVALGLRMAATSLPRDAV